jgi:hypothetical protein
MKYYAASNPQGFSNTARVWAFASKQQRDSYVSTETNAHAIKRSEINNYITPAKPFSGKKLGLLNVDGPWSRPDGSLGEVCVDWVGVVESL